LIESQEGRVFKSLAAGLKMYFDLIKYILYAILAIYGGFLKWWVSPTTMGFPTKNDHVGVLWGVPPFKETPIYRLEFISSCAIFNLSNLHSDKDRQGLPNQLATFWWNSLPSAPPWCHGNHVQKLEEIKGATPRQHFVGEILLDWIWPNYIIFHQPTFA